jgi:hypothetical protein
MEEPATPLIPQNTGSRRPRRRHSGGCAPVGTGIWREHVAEALAEGVENYKLLCERKQRPKTLADYRRAAK